MDEKKICIKCKQSFPKTDQHFRRAPTKDGFMGMCKTCRRKYEQDFRAGNRIREGAKKEVKKRLAHLRDSNPAPAPIREAVPVQTASPTEIVIALRKGMAAEIVAMINERYGL